ncbi:MAG: alpha-amylase family glycosyl hydrolase [Planctomycetota bacterium]|nr:alpha-amylase family glycosyl hydrolase [Planctomycetota bacterium]
MTPWTHDWYRQEDWARSTGQDFYTTVQMRRYGGDLEGVMARLDYLQELGVTAIYLNPINDSPSLHKYDARSYHHVDRNFGPDPAADRRLVEREEPDEPSTWTWTRADGLFLQLIQEIHRRGMRVVVDVSWNHTGVTFWAWRDVLEKQAASRYADWYEIERFDDPDTPANEFRYSGWAGVRELPELKKVRVPGRQSSADRDLHPEVKAHIFAVTRRWLDPDGDGDPSDGVDGFRLDVAKRLPVGFWRDYRQLVKAVNPDALLVAELWWEEWPDRLLDPAPWLQGDMFDAVMNYRWYAATRSFITGDQAGKTPEWYAGELRFLERGVPRAAVEAMMNVAATHDTPRLSTSLQNRGRYKYRASPRENPAYQVQRPNPESLARQKLLLIQQFTWTGAPHIWYGDEVGMWGADDPDCRKPMIWDELTYEDESALPSRRSRHPDRVAPDRELFGFYQRLVRLRRRFADLFRRGTTRFLTPVGRTDVLVYRRRLGDLEAVITLNRSERASDVAVPVLPGRSYEDVLRGETLTPSRDRSLVVSLRALEGRILLRQ